MGVGVRQIEASTENVAELVVHRHPHAAEDGAAKPCPVQCEIPSILVLVVPDQRGSASAKARRPSVASTEKIGLPSRAYNPSNRVRHRVQAAGHAEWQRKSIGQRRVVNDRLRQDFRPTAGLLDPVLGLAQNGRDLGPCVGGGDDDLSNARPRCDRLAETCGGAAADGNDPVGAEASSSRRVPRRSRRPGCAWSPRRTGPLQVSRGQRPRQHLEQPAPAWSAPALAVLQATRPHCQRSPAIRARRRCVKGHPRG